MREVEQEESREEMRCRALRVAGEVSSFSLSFASWSRGGGWYEGFAEVKE